MQFDKGHERAAAAGDAKTFGEAGIHFLEVHAEEAARDLAAVQEAFHDIAGEIDGDGETDASAGAAGADDGVVDADEAALGIHERAAGIALVDGGIGLDEILVAGVVIGVFIILHGQAAAERADDAARDGLAEAEGVAEGEDDIADLKLGPLSPRVMAGRLAASILRTAISVAGSVPMILAGYSILSLEVVTLTSSAPSTT